MIITNVTIGPGTTAFVSPDATSRIATSALAAGHPRRHRPHRRRLLCLHPPSALPPPPYAFATLTSPTVTASTLIPTTTVTVIKIPIGPVAEGAALLTDPAVEPPLDASNVVSRFVYVPPEVWPGLSAYGWVAKVKSLHMHRPQKCMLLFHDDTVPFALETVLGFKPVS